MQGFIKFFALAKGENGGVIPFVAVVILGIAALTGLMIDTSREEISLTEVQTAADSASLSAARSLNGTVAGWRAAKRAAVAALKESLPEIRGANLSNITWRLDEGTMDALDTEGSYQGTSGDIGNISLKIERGVFWAVGPEKNDMEFLSLERDANGETSSALGVERAADFGLPPYLIANAVQVTLSLNNLATSFARVFGVSEFNSLTRVSTAVFDTELEECVFPVAVTACSLMMDLNADRAAGEESEKYQTEAYMANQACQREVIATEVDPRGLDRTGGKAADLSTEEQKRVEGFVRAESYYRYPYREVSGPKATICFPERQVSGNQPNCLAIPFEGTLGIPELTAIESAGRFASNRAASGQDIADVITRRGGCIPTRIGARFRPLEDPRGFLNDERVASDLAQSISTSPLRLDEVGVFGSDKNSFTSNQFPNVRRQQVETVGLEELDGDENDQDRRDRNDARRLQSGIASLLDLRRDGADAQAELRLTWASDQDPNDSLIMSDMLAADKEVGIDWSGDFGNPMCHDERLVNVDHPEARAREVTIMVIASKSENTPYCDTAALYNQQQQDSFAPMAGTDPVVVGFKKAYLFDFNILDLEQARWGGAHGSPSFERLSIPGFNAIQRPPLIDSNPSQRDPLSRSALYGRYVDHARRVVADHLDWLDCAESCDSDGAENCDECRDKAAEMETIEDIPVELLLQMEDECFEAPSEELAEILRKLLPLGAEWLAPGITEDGDWRRDTRRLCGHGNNNSSRCTREARPIYGCDGECSAFQTLCHQIIDDAIAAYPGDTQSAINQTIEQLTAYCPNAMGPKYPPDIEFAELAELYQQLEDAIKGFGKAKENTHCLPRKLQNCWQDTAECWEDPQPRRSGWGCGGLRLRLSCNDGGTIPSPNRELQAAIVD